MKKLLFFIATLPIGFISCQKADATFQPSGVYTEVSPWAGATQLNFIDGALVIRSDSGSYYKDTFLYNINGNSISLSIPWSSYNSGTSLYFHVRNANEFTIQNLNPSIPEAPIVYMTFKKS